jgi:hypothetical protein
MKNKNILAITLAVTMGFANAGFFDDIGTSSAAPAIPLPISSKIPAFTNPIVVTSIIANILLFFIISPMITPKLAPKNPNKNILAITLAVTMGFANAGFFDDIGNGMPYF